MGPFAKRGQKRGPKKGSKTGQKWPFWLKKGSKMGHFLGQKWAILGSYWVNLGSRNGPKRGSKCRTRKRGVTRGTPWFLDCFNQIWGSGTPKMAIFGVKKGSKMAHFWGHFWAKNGVIFGPPFWGSWPNPSTIGGHSAPDLLKTGPKMGSKMGQKWGQKGVQKGGQKHPFLGVPIVHPLIHF